MYRYSESSYSRISDLGPGSDYELAFLPIAAASLRSQKRYDTDELELLGPTDTSYSSAYAEDSKSVNGRPTQRPGNEKRRGGKIGQYFRLYDPEDVGTSFRGWRKAVIAAAIITGFVLLVNTVFMIVARVKFDARDGVGVIYEGDCNLVKRWDTAMHLLINLLGTALLAASSFTMQCLSSPTRSEVNAAHVKRVSLEIGMQSVKNLFYVRAWKGIIWLSLCLSTMPLHLLWNSTIFSTTGTNLFSAVVVTANFTQGATYQLPNSSYTYRCNGYTTTDPKDVITTIYNGNQAGKYVNLSASDCLSAYTGDYISIWRNLIIVVDQPRTGVRMSDCGYGGRTWNGSSVIVVDTNLYPGIGWTKQIGEFARTTNRPNLTTLQQEVNSKGTWSLGNNTVKSCRAESTTVSSCQLQFVSYILYVVVGCNLVKFIGMCIAARYLWNLDEPILATVGDTVSTFLEHPDETTKGLCLLDLDDIRAGVWKRSLIDRTAYKSTYNRKPNRKLYSATTPIRWWLTMSLCTLYLIAGFVLWQLSLGLSSYTLNETMVMKFGAVDSSLTLGLPGESGGSLIVDVVVANSFQLALSTTYFLYNSLYTAQCAALEWASYTEGKRKSLRVTWPRGQQRSTYYLQLPYRYGIPLTILLILMHFLISQSIFLARLQVYDWAGKSSSDSFSDVGFSPRATITTCLVGVVMVLAQIAHACRPLKNKIPIHGNNSAVMSAMCHVEQDNDDGDTTLRKHASSQVNTDGIATKPITWGVTRKPADLDEQSAFSTQLSGHSSGHCSFSADVVELPEVGKSYI